MKTISLLVSKKQYKRIKAAYAICGEIIDKYEKAHIELLNKPPEGIPEVPDEIDNINEYACFFDANCPDGKWTASIRYGDNIETILLENTSTSNEGEWSSLIYLLQKLANLHQEGSLSAKKLHIHGDSELVIKQWNGEYKIKKKELKDLKDIAMQHYNCLKVYNYEVVVSWIPREVNNKALKLKD